MFFAPPKVKSLSRYAEYGAYLGTRHFFVMLAIAFTAHIALIAIYSMVPGVEIVRIPVRVLNIKLSGGNTGGTMQLPAPSDAPSERPVIVDKNAPADADTEEFKTVPEDNGETAVDKALTGKHVKPVRGQASHIEKAVHPAKNANMNAHGTSSEITFATPKKYVREGDAASGKSGKGNGKEGTGNGGNVNGDAAGTEVIERYTQKISQWIKNHQEEARERCLQAKDATGQCDAQGNVVVRIRIDRDGNILKNTIDTTSGKELVDQLAIQQVDASNPLPAVPSNFPESQLEFLIPVQVDLTAKQ